MKKNFKDMNKWRAPDYSWMRRLSVEEIFVLLQVSHFLGNPNQELQRPQCPTAFFLKPHHTPAPNQVS